MADDAEAAVAGADVVILATTSRTAVVETAWLTPDVVVSTVGPKQAGACEFPTDLITGAAFVVTDSPDQLAAYDPPAVAAGLVPITDLAEVVAGRVRPPGTGRRVYCSVGLAGTEVHLLGRLAEKVSRASGH